MKQHLWRKAKSSKGAAPNSLSGMPKPTASRRGGGSGQRIKSGKGCK